MDSPNNSSSDGAPPNLTNREQYHPQQNGLVHPLDYQCLQGNTPRKSPLGRDAVYRILEEQEHKTEVGKWKDRSLQAAKEAGMLSTGDGQQEKSQDTDNKNKTTRSPLAVLSPTHAIQYTYSRLQDIDREAVENIPTEAYIVSVIALCILTATAVLRGVLPSLGVFISLVGTAVAIYQLRAAEEHELFPYALSATLILAGADLFFALGVIY
jgi:hypothetical protein